VWIAVPAAVVPLAVAGILVVRPALDGRWEEPDAHFWLVGGSATAGIVVAVLAGEAANRRRDVRLVLLALAFATSAAFLGAHALATPGVVVDGSNNAFEAAVPLGLAVAAALAAASTLELDAAAGERVLRWRWLGWTTLGVITTAWMAASLTGAGPLDDPPDGPATDRVITALGLTGTALFAVAALRYGRIGRGRERGRARLLGAMVVALVLLADALIVVQIGRNWQATWWEWHLLMGAAFVVLAASARSEIRREGGRSGLFDAVALEQTLARVRADYADALEDLVDAMEHVDGDEGDQEVAPLVDAVARRFDLSDRQARLLEQAALALGENRRLYRELDTLFRSYLSPDVAAALRAEPDRSALGGAVAEVSVLHADLASFTAYAEHHPPAAVVGMLNTYFGAVVPAVLGEGGTITLFAGDAVMAVFGAPATQPDHARRACRAALALVAGADEVRGDRTWPRFRVGVCSGPALVGNVGSDALRSFTAIGDTVNLAARIEAAAPVGGVLISRATREAVGAEITAEPVGDLVVKGRGQPVTAYRLVGVDGAG
jgi:class 3 adenylate cyclase